MTAENNGAGPGPEGDDPFAHLYRQEGGDAGAAQQQSGVPRRSYNQVRNVGERQYGGYPRPDSSAHYAAPETVPGGRAAARQEYADPGHGSRGRRGNGLLIGAIAVVAAVVVGIGSAIVFNSDDSEAAGSAQAGASESAGGDGGKGDDAQQNGNGGKQQAKQQDLPQQDAATLRLDGGTTTDNAIKGAQSKGGTYVGNFQPGASATWTAKVDKPGNYKLYAQYGVPGKDMHLSLGVNGKPHATGMNMKNYSGAPEGAWDKGWQNTWALVHLNKGTNTFKISCETGDQCNVNLDRVWLKHG